MEPFSPQDPLHKLLGQAKNVEPRPNFTQNVLRTVRQLPQRESAWERVSAWFGGFGLPRVALAGGLALLVTTAIVLVNQPRHAEVTGSLVVQTKSTPTKQSALTKAVAQDHAEEIDFAQELDSMNQLTMVLAQQDTTTLSDADLALLLY